jgi:DNA-binding transcriptional ArsR family regulator
MLDIQVIDDPTAATVALEPIRSRLLSELAAPASAATLVTRVGLARQKVNYHLRALEARGLVRLAEERGWGGLATLAVDTEVRFRSATDRAAFSKELTEAIAVLVSKHHHESAPGGRAHRLVVVTYPLPQKSTPKEPS